MLTEPGTGVPHQENGGTGEEKRISRCPFHALFSSSTESVGKNAPISDEIKGASIQVSSSPADAGRQPLSQFLINRFRDFGVLVAEGLSEFTGFDFLQEKGQRSIPVIPYDTHLLKIGLELKSSPFTALREVFSRNGPDAQFILPSGQRVMFFSDQEIIRHVLLQTDSKSHAYTKGSLMVRASAPVFGEDNIVVASGDAWRTRRAAIAGGFGKSRFEESSIIKDIDDSILRSVRDLSDRIDQAGGALQVDMQKEMATMAMRVFLSTFFHIDNFPTARLESVRDALVTVLDAFPAEGLNILPVSLLKLDQMIPPVSNLAESNQVLDDFIAEVIAAGRERKGSKGDILDTLIAARDSETDQPLSDQTLREELKTLLVAGFENTGRSLAFCFKELSANPDELARVQQEVDAARGREVLKTAELSEAFPAALQNESETLRMYPTVYGISRHAAKADVIETKTGPVHIREGTTVILSPFFMQRREECFGVNITGYRANEYVPRRWTSENLSAHDLDPKELALASFGAGARVCLGQHFFKPEFLIALRRYVEAFSIKPVEDDFRSHLIGTFGLKSAVGLPVILSNRTAGQAAGTTGPKALTELAA